MKKLFYLLCVVLTACSGEYDTAAPQPQFSDQPWVYSEAFYANPRLHARDDQTLVVRIDDRLAASKSSWSGEQTVHEIPYYFEQDTDLKLTLDTTSPCIKSLKLTGSATGNELFQIDLQQPFVQMAIPRGSYTLTINEVTPLPDHCSSSFIYKKTAEASAPPPATAAGQQPFDAGEGIFRAFRLQQWIDTAKRIEYFKDNGYVVSIADQLAGQPISFPNQYITRLTSTITFMGKKSYPLIPEDASAPLKIGDPTHLMSLMPQDVGQKLYSLYAKALGPQLLYQATIIAYSPNSGKNWHYGAQTGCWAEEIIGWAQGDFTIQQTFHNGSIYGADYYKRENYKKRWTGSVLSFYENPSFDPYEFHITYDTGRMGGHTFALRKRDGSAGDNFIQTGVFNRICSGWEIGNYTYTLGLKEIYRFYDKATDLSAIGNNEVVVYSGANFTGQAVVFNTASSLPAVDFSGFPIRSIKVGHDATIKLFDARGYKGHVAVVGIDIPNTANDARFKDLGPVQSLTVFRAIDLVVSNDCPGCNLQDVNLSGHTLHNRDFRRTNFTRANLSSSSLSNAVLIDAILQNARLDNANLKGANMCRALLNKDPIQQKAATLNGAYLQNVNLAFAELSGASFVNANFHSMTTKDSCVPDINCATTSCASAHKATMSNTDFTGAF